MSGERRLGLPCYREGATQEFHDTSFGELADLPEDFRVQRGYYYVVRGMGSQAIPAAIGVGQCPARRHQHARLLLELGVKRLRAAPSSRHQGQGAADAATGCSTCDPVDVPGNAGRHQTSSGLVANDIAREDDAARTARSTSSARLTRESVAPRSNASNSAVRWVLIESAHM